MFLRPPRSTLFPTRRSSDLTGESERLKFVLTGASAFSISGDGDRIAWVKSTHSAPGDVYLEDLHSGRETRLSDINPQDRKSTRLNSSHMSISYAVFCLKKKK